MTIVTDKILSSSIESLFYETNDFDNKESNRRDRFKRTPVINLYGLV